MLCDMHSCFGVQENDPGEILWEQFSLPELKNFLLILDREEAWYKRRQVPIRILFYIWISGFRIGTNCQKLRNET
jgi:hypothetical protein